MAGNSFGIKNSINFTNESTPTLNEAGDLGFDPVGQKFQIHNGSNLDEVITAVEVQVLENKIIVAADNTITTAPNGNLVATELDAALAELQSDIDGRALSSTVSTHTGASSGVHGVTGSVVGTSDSQVLTNKDIDGGTASNSKRITVPKDTLANLQALTRKEGTFLYATDTTKFYGDNGSALVPVGSGSGSGKNYLSDGDAEGTNSWTIYDDASAIPSDLTGGSTSLTVTSSSTNPLTGLKSWILTPHSSLGEGAAYAFTLDREDRYQVMALELSLEVASGTYVDDDLAVYLYDVTNSQLIYASPVSGVKNSTINSKQVFYFQTTSSTSYRLGIHQATANNGYTMKFEAKLGPKQVAGYAPIQTDFVSYTPTFTAVTASNIEVKYAIDGELLKVFGRFTHTGGTGALTMTLPNGKLIKSTDVAASNYRVCGTGGFTTTTQGSLTVLAQAGLQTLAFGFDGTTSNAPYTGAWASETMTFFAEVPIEGQSSQAQVISEYDGRVVAAKYLIADGVTTDGSTPLNAATKVYDSHSSVTTGSGWKFTAPIAGKYQVSLHAYFGSGNEYIYVYKNGTKNALIGLCYTATLGAGTVELELNVGDYVDIRGNASITTAGSQGSYASICISLLSGAQQILAGQRITTRVYLSTTTAFSVGTPIIFDSKVEDTTNSYNVSTGLYTAPVSGDYLVTFYVYQGVGSGLLLKTSGGTNVYVAAENTGFKSGAMMVYLLQGETLELDVDNATGVSGGNMTSGAQTSHMEIKQVN